MSTQVIPVLMSDVQHLDKPEDIIKYILRHYMYSPKNISDTFNDQEISFRFDDASVGDNPTRLSSIVKANLTKTLMRCFQGAIVVVDVTTTDVDTVKYDIVISILVSIGELTYTLTDSFRVSNDGEIDYNIG